MNQSVGAEFLGAWWGMPKLISGPLGVAVWLAAILAVGWFLPRLAGIEFYDPYLMLSYGALAALFAPPPLCEAVCADAGRRLTKASLYAKAAAAASFGVVSVALVLAVRVAAVNTQWPAPRLILPSARVVAAVLLVAMGCAVLSTGLAAMAALNARQARSARQIMRTGFLAAMLAAVVVGRKVAGLWLALIQPGGALVAAAILTGLGVLLWRTAAGDARYSGREAA